MIVQQPRNICGRFGADAAVCGRVAAVCSGGAGQAEGANEGADFLRLSRATVAAFRATGEGWQSRIDEALAKAAKDL
jgi:hypothetical protein